MKKRLLMLSAYTLLVLSACKEGTLVDEFQSVENNAWDYADLKTLEVQVTDTTKFYDLLINLRHAGNYEWQNLYLRMHIYSPKGDSTTERLSVMLADAKGKWLGSGLGDLVTLQAPYKQGIQFRQIGTYRFVLEQHMRVNPLDGIDAIGLLVRPAESAE